MLKTAAAPRRVAMMLLTIAVVALWTSAAPLGAATTTTTVSSAPTATLPHGPTTTAPPEVLNDITVGAAVVTTPGQPTRQLNLDQNTAFMQTWLPSSVVEKLPHQQPPVCLPVSTLKSSITYKNSTVPMTVYYATDGANAWVGMPAQSLGFASVQSETWIQSPEPPETIAAFAGNLQPVDIASGVAPSSVPTPTGTTIVCSSATGKAVSGSTKGSSGTAGWVWVVIAIAVVVVALGGWVLMRGRARAKVA